MIPTPVAALLLLASLVFLVASQLLIKWRFNVLGLQSNQVRDLWDTLSAVVTDVGLLAAGLLLICGASMWYAAMTRFPISFVVPIAAAVSPLIALCAHFLLGERLSFLELVLIVMIAVLVATFGVIHAHK